MGVRLGSLVIVAKALSEYISDLVGLQEVRWEGGGMEPAGENTFLYREGNENHKLRAGFIVHKRDISAVKRVVLLVIGCHTEY
jgi:hypothetical protein